MGLSLHFVKVSSSHLQLSATTMMTVNGDGATVNDNDGKCATVNNNNNNGKGATGDEVDDDGNGVMGDDDGNSATGDDVDNNGDSATGDRMRR